MLPRDSKFDNKYIKLMALSFHGRLDANRGRDNGDYVTGKQLTPSEACCKNLKAARSQATTPEDKRKACRCAQEGVVKMKDVMEGAVSNLPDKCGSPLPYKFSLTFDCRQLAAFILPSLLTFVDLPH